MRPVPGKQRLIVLQLEALGAMPLLVERLPRHQPEYHRGVHTHDFLQLMYIESGSGAVHLGEDSVELGAGHVVLVGPNQPHDTTDVDDGTDAWVLSVPAGLARPSLLDPAGLPREALVVPGSVSDTWSRRITTIERELREERYGFAELVTHEVDALLIELVRLVGARPAPARPLSPLTRRVLEIIEHEHTGPLSLADIARRLGRSSAYLTTRVRKETGKPVTQLILEQRLQSARRWLAETDELIDVIAERCGFTDPGYFTRVFRGRFGVSPRAWRQAHGHRLLIAAAK